MPQPPSPGSLRDSALWEILRLSDDGRGGSVETWLPDPNGPVLCSVRPRRATSAGDYQQSAMIPTHGIIQRYVGDLVPGAARAVVSESNGRTFTAELVRLASVGRMREWQLAEVRETGPGVAPS